MSISSATAFAAYGMSRAIHRFETAAHTIARSTDPDYQSDTLGAMIETLSAQHAFDANLSTFRTMDEMMGKVLNLKA